MPAPLTQTTITADISASARTIPIASATGVAAGSILVIGQEAVLVQSVNATALTCEVMRGHDGTRAKKHNSGALVYVGSGSTLGIDPVTGQITVAGYTGELGDMTLPLGSKYFDPDTGNEYTLVDCGATFINGEWVVLDGSFLATQLAIGSKGRVGIVTETPGASDQLAWVLTRGTYASALFDSDVTTAMQLGAAAGFAAPYDSTNGVLIERATCTTAPSTATSPTVGDGLGTAYVDNPWVNGVATFVS
jgi:hypothetical protein